MAGGGVGAYGRCVRRGGVVHDRDVNAAANLRNMAVSSTVAACGEEGAGSGRKTRVKPASTKQEVSGGFAQQ